MSSIALGSLDWSLSGDGSPDPRHLWLELDARLDLPFTVNVGTGINETIHFRLKPRIDPELKVDGGWLDIDLGQCPTYFGLTPPPADLKVDAAHQDNETKARKAFLSKLLRAAGGSIRGVLERLLALPREVFHALRTQVPKYIDQVLGFFPDFLGIEDNVKRRLERLFHAIEEKVRDAMGWVMSLARDVARWLLTEADQLGSLAADACRAVIESLLVLYEGVLDGAKRLGDVLHAAFVTMAKDAARYAEQIRAAILGLVQSSIVSAKEFAADVERYVAAGLTELVRTYGLAEERVTAFFRAVAKGVVEGAAAAGRAARDACDFFCRVLESAVAGLHKIAGDPAVLYIWIGTFIRAGLELFVDVAGVAAEWTVWVAHGIGRVARGIAAVVADFAQKTAAALEPYVKPALEAMAELAKTFGKATREAFTSFLQKLASWSRAVFHAACRVLHATQDLLVQIIGPDAIDDVKEALRFLCTFLEEVGAKVGQAIDALYRFGRFVAIDLPRSLAELAAPLGKQLAGFASSLGAALEKAFRVVLEIGGYVRSSPVVQALTAIVGAIMDLAEAAGAAIVEKGRQLGEWMRPKIDEALAKLDEMANALGALMAGTGEGSVLEARFRRLSIAKPRGSNRSQARVKILPAMPSAYTLPGDDVLLPALQALAGDTGLELGALELLGFDDWRFSAPHPVSGLLDLSPPGTPKSRFLPVPFAPDKDVVFRVCLNPRFWVIDPRYSWGYGSSNQLRLADIDGDGKVDEWEVWKTAQSRRDAKKRDPDADPFTAADLQTMLDQAKNVLHGVPYHQIGAPFGLLAAYDEGSWTWFSIANIGNEDVGAQVQDGSDPKAPVGSVLRAGAAGTVIPSGEKVDRSGIGIFCQGLQRFGAGNYPIRYHVEKRIFWDQFASGFGNSGTSTFLVVRGGHAGNDFQLRGELYADFTVRSGGSGIGLPTGMYTPTIRATWGFGANVGAVGAAQGGFRFGLEYASKSPIAVLMGDEAKSQDEGVVDKIIAKLKEDFKVEQIVPLLEKAVVPVLRLLMFDQEFEAKLACAGAIAIGVDLAIEKKKTWARAAEGRNRTLRLLEQAEVFFDDWKHSEEVRREEEALRAEAARNKPVSSKKANDELAARVKRLWASALFTEEQHKDLTEIRQLHRTFMRSALKQPTSPEDELEQQFATWLRETQPAAQLSTFEDWLATQRQSRYLTAAGGGAQMLKNQIWAGDFAGAWKRLTQSIAKIDATTGEYADEICEAIIAVASLVDIFYRMAVALGNVKGLRTEVSADLNKRRKDRDEKANAPAPAATKAGPTILGRIGAQAHDGRWAEEVLRDASSWGKKGTGLADGLSLVWSIDGGIGAGIGGSAGGTGLGAFAIAGVSVTPPPYFKMPSELLAKLSSKLMLVRFAAKFVGALLDVIAFEVESARDLPSEAGALIEKSIAWCVQAVHQTLEEVLTPGKAGDARHANQADPLEDWLLSFLSGTTLSFGAKLEGYAKAVGTALSAEARGSVSGEISVTLASLLDPLIEALQQDASRDPGDKAPLSVRSVPKMTLSVKQSLSAGVAVGPAQLDLGLTGQSLTADLLFPDGSPVRRAIEKRLSILVGDAVVAAKMRGRQTALQKQDGGFLHGVAALYRAIESLLRAEIPAVLDYEKKSGEEGPGVATALVTNPSIQRIFDVIRDPRAAKKRKDEKDRRLNQLVEIVRTNTLDFRAYPDQPGVGVKATPTPSNAFDVCVLLPDAEAERFSPTKKVLLETCAYRIPLEPMPAHIAQDTFRRKGDPKAPPLNGLVVGFRKKSEAEAFASKRDGGWVDASVAAIPPWPSSRAGASGTAQWYHWLNTKLFVAIEEARGKGRRIEQPRAAVDDKGVLLTFGLVDRGLLDNAPFSSFGLIKENQTYFTEATVLEGAWEDDVVRLRAEVAASISRGGQCSPAVAEVSPEAAATATPPAPPTTVRYSVKRAQLAVNHRLRDGGFPGWATPLATDGRFGPKTGAALDAWSKSLGAPPVRGERGAPSIEIGQLLARALDDAQDAAILAFAEPHTIPEDDAPWMSIARNEVGQKEVRGIVDNPRIREYHSSTTLGEQHDEVAWCSSFVNWSLMKAGVRGTRSAAAASWAEWGAATEPRRGAIVVIYNQAAKNSGLTRSGNHVGFLVEDVGWGWKLLGGNQSNMVRETCFPKKKWTLKAVRWPT